MATKIKKALICLIIFTFIFTLPVKATDSDEITMFKGSATGYCLHGTTASGTKTRPGICAAKKEWLGKTVILYKRLPDGSVGDLIGIYEVQDTGGTKGLKNGTVIDIWCEDIEEVQELMNLLYENNCKGKVYWQVIDAEG